MGTEPESHKNVEYVIDETTVLEGGDRAYHVWDLEQDPSKEDKFQINAISRSGVEIRSYLLPQEEVRHFVAGNEVWWEHRGEPDVKLDETMTISERDSDPFVHHGDYALVLAVPPSNTESEMPRCPKVTLKLRELDET